MKLKSQNVPMSILVLFFQIIRPLPGETCSGAYEIWRQLNTLQHLIKGLESLEIVWFVKSSQKTLREEIDKLIAAFCKDETDQLKGSLTVFRLLFKSYNPLCFRKNGI